MPEDLTLPAPGAPDDATRLAPEGLTARLPYDAPSRIGPYHLVRRIGEGGMGEVWEAEQREPMRRRVAIKLVKVGMDTRHFVARFEAERQALALMEHPAIARVIDGGATETGRPYLVMEFVEGEPITRYCDARRLGTRQRLELFMQVCDGVEHAHRRGILHRDLKPSNVLVAERDGEPVPKIIDFGVAKAIAEPLTDRTLHTAIGGWIGTPAYMSPEQADVRGDIDTRTDVYSLGVMLYELLTGVRPLPEETVDSAAPDELRRLIREREAPRPSARFSALGGQTTAIAGARSTDAPELARRLRGDLDWIVLKAIEKDRERRYGSPSQLADDIRRHLANEPVVARPPSTIYRAGRFVRRHKLVVAAGGDRGAGLVAAVVGTGDRHGESAAGRSAGPRRGDHGESRHPVPGRPVRGDRPQERARRDRHRARGARSRRRARAHRARLRAAGPGATREHDRRRVRRVSGSTTAPSRSMPAAARTLRARARRGRSVDPDRRWATTPWR